MYFTRGLRLFQSTTGNGADDEKRLLSSRDRLGQRRIRRLKGQILLAGEEPQERAAFLGGVIADRPAQHRMAGFERIEDRAQGHRALDLKLDVTLDTSQRPQ